MDSLLYFTTGSVRRGGGILEWKRIQLSSAPSNGAGNDVVLRSIDISPFWAETYLCQKTLDPSCVATRAIRLHSHHSPPISFFC